MSATIGILLINLGTPKSPRPFDVYKYLIEFLTDPRVIKMSWLKRQLLVRGFIVPTRFRQSAKAYEQIWTTEGSPLLVYGKKVKEKLQHSLGPQFLIKLAMRYQEPSIAQEIATLMKAGIDHLIVLPLFPQYASATTGSVLQRVQEELSRYTRIPDVTLISEFATDPDVISSFCTVAKEYPLTNYDHVLFSFHGLPEKDLLKEDQVGKCKCNPICCRESIPENRHCYAAQCYATADAMIKSLEIDPDFYSIAFQSRLGKDPWLQPYTSEVIKKLAEQGKKKILVFCPSFVCDCLETTYEIGIEYNHEFNKAGGDHLQLVPGLNEHPRWIDTLKNLILKHINNKEIIK